MPQRLALLLALSVVITLLLIAPAQQPKLVQASFAGRTSLERAQAAVEDQPRSPELRLRLAQLLIEADALEEARSELERAMELDERLPGTHVLLARIDHRQGEWESAAGHLAQASALQPGSRELALLAASALIEVKRDDEARTILLRLIRDHAEDPTPRVLLAELFARRGQWSLAIAAMEQAVPLAPSEQRSTLLAQLGEWETARLTAPR